jgi:hypothetical protein
VKRSLAIAAAALLLAVNGWVLLGVARNRFGEPDATLTLSERELQVGRSTGRENSGVELVLQVNQWQPGKPIESRYEQAAWLPPQRLAELGFDLALPTSLEEARRLARRQLARRGWAVVQLGGGPWERWAVAVQDEIADLDRKIAAGAQEPWKKEQRRQLEHELQTGTRLFMVDAASDADALRAIYPDRAAFLILPAEVHLDVWVEKDSSACVPPRCRPVGRVSLLTGSLQVPRHLQPLLPPEPPPSRVARDDDLHRPRFSAVVRSGARREAWLESILPATATPPGPTRPATER